jgi:poly(A) polymerase
MAIGTQILGKLRFSNDDTEQILSLVQHHMKFKDVGRMKPATLKRFVRLPRFEEHLALHRLDCLSSHRNLEAYEFVIEFLRTTPPQEVRPVRLVAGEDVLRLGYKPGPLVGEILAAVEEAQLNGELASKEEAISFVHSKFRRKQVEYQKSGKTNG